WINLILAGHAMAQSTRNPGRYFSRTQYPGVFNLPRHHGFVWYPVGTFTLLENGSKRNCHHPEIQQTMILHYLKLIWHRRRKNAFLTAELVLAFLVVFGVLAFAIRQFSKLVVPEGFNTENVYNIIPSIAGDLDSITYKNMREQFKQEILNLPDVRNLTLATEVTPYGESSWSTFTKLGGSEAMVDYIMCDENFADVWQVKMVSGNFFTEGDLVGKYLPVVVNQLFVDNFLKDTTALGYIFEMMGKEV